MSSSFFDETLARGYENAEFSFPADSLDQKVVVLAGGSGGLGAAAAALLVREGAHVVVGYHENRARAEQLRGKLAQGSGTITLCGADIRRQRGRTTLLDAARELGPLFGLAVFTGDPARGASESVLQSSMDVNYLGPLLLARDAADHMREEATPGSIVLFSSMQGGYPFEGSTAYGAAKAALVQGAKVLAKECGGRPNIRVNVVAPGATMAGMAQTSLRSGKYDRFVAEGIIPRFGRAEDVARTVRFLLEPDSYITGQVITVDGGMTLRRDMRDG